MHKAITLELPKDGSDLAAAIHEARIADTKESVARVVAELSPRYDEGILNDQKQVFESVPE